MFVFKPLEEGGERTRESIASKSHENATGNERLRHFVCLYKKLLFVAADSSYPPEIPLPVTPRK
jgi:hypothetical protein